jgi:hypothetical protein
LTLHAFSLNLGGAILTDRHSEKTEFLLCLSHEFI